MPMSPPPVSIYKLRFSNGLLINVDNNMQHNLNYISLRTFLGFNWTS
jgi:hypothetical protein